MRMRIITGTLGGREFDAPRGNRTHPMSEQIRGAVFNILGDIKGLTVLDCFAGSGAISFEALSRGAKHATLIEQDKTAHKTIAGNIEQLGLEDRVLATRANIKGWSNSHRQDWFDIVVCDPPYDAVLETLIQKLARHVIRGGLLVLSWPTPERIPAIEGMEILRHKTYGNATLVFYKKTG